MTPSDHEPRTEFADLMARGRKAWPAVDVPDDALARAFARTPLAASSAPALAAIHHDVFLACACIAGSESAARAFEQSIMIDVPLAVRRVDTSASFVDDLTADLRAMLLAGDGGDPGLVRYAGRGPLRSFVMVLAMRRALDRKRRQREVPTEADTFERLLSSAAGGAASAVAMPSTLRDAFVLALKEGLASLEPRERNVLRMHYVDGVSADALGRTYKVHRATMTRWIADARSKAFTATQERMIRDGAISPESFASFARDAQSLDATLSTFLRATDVEEPGEGGTSD